jgi:DNA-binding response OmpR family regulator
MKILLIDDNERLATIYQSILENEGHKIEMVIDSSTAVSAARDTRPDLILLDIMMEPLSGWEVLHLIREDAQIADTPIIVLTGKILTINEAIKYGLMIEGFVMKPLERSMLVTAVSEIAGILAECEERYNRAINAGKSEDIAIECRKKIRKRKMLTHLKDLLERQERMVHLRPELESEMNQVIEELRKMVSTEYQDFAQAEKKCP